MQKDLEDLERPRGVRISSLRTNFSLEALKLTLSRLSLALLASNLPFEPQICSTDLESEMEPLPKKSAGIECWKENISPFDDQDTVNNF